MAVFYLWLILGFISAIASARGGVLFHAGFSGEFDADESAGSPVAKIVGEVALTEGMNGGRAALVKSHGGFLQYETDRNVFEQAGSIEMWVRPIDWVWRDSGHFTFLQSELESSGLFSLYKANGSAIFFIGGERQPVMPGSPVRTNNTYRGVGEWGPEEWHQLVITWDDKRIRLILDGGKSSSGSPTYPHDLEDITTAEKLRLGNYFTIGGQSYSPVIPGHTAIDEITIFQRILSDEEIAERYQAKLEGRIPGEVERKALSTDYFISSQEYEMSLLIDVTGSPVGYQDLTAEIRFTNDLGEEVLNGRIDELKSLRERYHINLISLDEGRYCVTVVIADRQGKQVGQDEFDFHVFDEPEGVPNKIGITDKAPPPWTPVEMRENGVFHVWGRQYDFDGVLLPRQINVLGEDILSGPLAYEVEYADGTRKRVMDGRMELLEAREGYVEFAVHHESDDGLRITQKTRLEFDGMARVDAHVQSGRDIRSLRLRIPVLEQYTRFFRAYAGKAQFAGLAEERVDKAFQWSSPYLHPCLWLADHRRGISWFAGTDRTWKVDGNRERLAVDAGGITVTFADTREPGLRELEFTYGIQAMPTRPERENYREFGRFHKLNFQTIFEPGIGRSPIEKILENRFHGTDWSAWPSLVKRNQEYHALGGLINPFANFPRGIEYKEGELSDELYEKAMSILPDALQSSKDNFEYLTLYITPNYSSDAIPEWDWFRSEWEAIPRHGFATYRQPRANVADSRYCDFFMYNLEKWLKTYKINGLFHDMAGVYANRAESLGAGYMREGVFHDEFPLWETREIFKRVYTLHRELYPDAMSIMHATFNVPPVHTFGDFLLHEHYLHRIARSIYEIDGDGNIERFSDRIPMYFGLKPMILAWVGSDSTAGIGQQLRREREPSIHMYGLVLLHDAVVYGTARGNLTVARETGELKELFGLGYYEPINYIPYWEAETNIIQDDADFLRTAAYARDDNQAMLVVVNTTRQHDETGEFKVDLEKLGINQVSRMRIFDPLENIYEELDFTVDGETLKFEINVRPTLYKAVLIN